MKYWRVCIPLLIVLSIGCQSDVPDEDEPGDDTAVTSTETENEEPETGGKEITQTDADDRETEDSASDVNEQDSEVPDSLDSESSQEHGNTDGQDHTGESDSDVDTGLDQTDPEPSEGDSSMVLAATQETTFLPIRAEMPVFVNAVAVDAANDVVVGGNTWGDLYGKNTFYGTNDVISAKFRKDGKFIRGLQFGTRAMDIVNGVLADDEGNTYLTGRTAGAMKTHFGMEDFFVTKIDSNSQRKWTGQFGSTDPGSDFAIYEDIAYTSAIDEQKAVYMAGTTDSLGSIDGLIVKFDSTGAVRWNKVLEVDALSIDIWALTVSSDNKVYVTGMVGYSGKSGIDYDLFAAGVDGVSQEQIFYQEWGVKDAQDYGKAIVTDKKGNIYIAGQSGYELLFIALDADQNEISSKKFTLGSSWIEPRAIALDSKEDIYIGGSIADNKFNQGMTDLFVMKIKNETELRVEWQLTGGTELEDMVNDLEVGENDAVYAAGSYRWDLFNPQELSSNGFLLIIHP